MKLSLSAAFLLLVVPLSAATSASFNVRDYGAVGDGTAKDTAAINRTIAACAQAGGGTVLFPAGRYLSGSIHLESNQTIELSAGSTLLYSPDPQDSPLVESRWEDTTAFTHGPLLYANGKENVSIVGHGTIDGQGHNWWPIARKNNPAMAVFRQLEAKINGGYKPTKEDFAQAAEAIRPTLVELVNCKNVHIEDVKITQSPFWLLHPLYSENISVTGVSFVSTGPNGDGIDVDSCRNVRISGCFFRTGDDCIVIKSGRDEDGRRIHRPTEFVTITNCVMYEGHGAVVIGSETSGDIRDITASNIVAKGTDVGVRIKSQRGRGAVVENLRFDNFVVHDAKKQAIEITLRYGKIPPEPLSDRTPIFRNFAFSNFTIVNAHEIVSIHGLEEKTVDGLRFTDITATGKTGFVCDLAHDVELHHVRIEPKSGAAFVVTNTTGLVTTP
jgi:polygalacturonase